MDLQIINHLNVLESAGLVRLARVTPDLEYLFRHTLVREAAYASLLEEDLKRLHLEVGEILAEVYADQLDEIAGTLGLHFERAGEEQRALHYYTLAGKTALEVFANQDAENYFRNAYKLAGMPSTQAEMLNYLGEALYRQSRFNEAIGCWQEAIQYHQSVRDFESCGHLFSRSARAAWFSGDPARGLRLCQQGMEVITGAPEGPGVAQLLHETARAYFFNGMHDKAMPLCKEALHMAEKHAAVDVQADALTTLGILPDVGAEESLAALETAVALAESAGLLHTATRAHINLGTMRYTNLADTVQSREHLLKAAGLARQRGVVQEELYAMIGWIGITIDVGELDQAEQVLPRLQNQLSELPSSNVISNEIQMAQITIRAMRHGWENHIQALRRLAEKIHLSDEMQSQANINGALIDALLDLDDLKLLEDCKDLDQALAKSLELAKRGLRDEVRVYAGMSIAKARQKQFAEARDWQEKTRGTKPGKTPIWWMINLNLVEAELAKAEKRWQDADRAYQLLTVENKPKISRWLLARLLMDWAETFLLRGEPEHLERAQEILQESLEIFTQIGAPYYANLVDKLLKASRVQTLVQAVAQKSLAQELAQARRIQDSFLPEETPSLPGWQIVASLQPARQTSGDFYDFIPLPNGQLGIVIADVTDKGMGAALYMASTRTLLRAFASEFPHSPSQAIGTINQHLIAGTHGGLFVTLFYAVLDPNSGILSYCNAGHNPPLLFSAGPEGNALPLVHTGVPIGIFTDYAWQQGEVNLEPGGMLVLFTDGVTEAFNSQGEEFGEQRLLDVIRICRTTKEAHAQAVQDCIHIAIRQFRGETPQSDDITLLVILRETP